MLKKFKALGITLGLLSLVAVPVLVTSSASAEVSSNFIQQQLCNGSSGQTDAAAAADCTDGGGTGGLDSILRKIIQIFSVIVGFVAVVMIIVGGIKYITSGGDSGNVSGAKNTIIYAIIGLIIVALAQVLVHYVLKNVPTS